MAEQKTAINKKWADFFLRAARQAFRPRPRITGSQWADSYRVVAPGTSPEPGPWHTDRVPYMREPLDMATSHKVEKVVIMAASQVAKSELLLNVMGYYADQEPAPQLMLQPTIEGAEAFSKERIDPTFKASPALKDKLIDSKIEERGSSRKSGNTIRLKQFPGGYLALVGSNSPSGLASRPIRVLLCDEIDRYGITKEGDPLKLSVQRTQNFNNRKIIFVSTPTTTKRADGPTIYEEFLRSDQREYYVLCPHCHERYTLSWGNVKWNKNDKGEVIHSSIRMECPHCHAKVRGPGRPDPYSLSTGVWIPQAKSKIIGYHLTALCSPWVSLDELVDDWIAANKDPDKKGLREFLNLKLGEPWREDEANLNLWEKLSERREWYSPKELPNEALFLTCGVDVQHDRLEATVYGWGVGWESWGVCHKVFYGDPKTTDVFQQLDLLLTTTFKTVTGREMRIKCTFVDSGDGEYTDTVYQYTKRRESLRVFASKGSSVKDKAIVDRPTDNNAYKAKLFVLGVWAGKLMITRRLAIQDVGPGFIHYTRDRDAGFNENFFMQLTAEVFERRFEKSKLVEGWRKIRERNETFDCAVYALAAAMLVNPDFEKLKEVFAAGKTATKTINKKRSPVLSKGISL